MKKTSLASMILAGLLMAAGGAYAHSNDYLDTVKTPHGGQLRMAGMYHYELEVAKDSKEIKDNPIIVHVTDHAGQKIATAGAAGTATILVGKVKTTAPLVSAGDNRMKGSAQYISAPGMKAVISITLPGKPAEQARFTPLDPEPDQHMKH